MNDTLGCGAINTGNRRPCCLPIDFAGGLSALDAGSNLGANGLIALVRLGVRKNAFFSGF